jgi:hypothetical protein
VQDVSEATWDLPVCQSIYFWRNCSFPIPQHLNLALIFICISGISLIFFLFVLKKFSGMHDLKVEESKTIPNDLINYVFPYIVSFMGLDLGSTGKMLGFFLFLIWMFLISYRSGQILMNPLLLVAGWQLYEIQADIQGNKRLLRALSKDPVTQGQRLRSCLVQGIYVLSKPK